MTGASGIEGELLDDRFLEEVRQLIADGIVQGPPCRFLLEHLHSVWFTEDGRLVCGICHPPAAELTPEVGA